ELKPSNWGKRLWTRRSRLPWLKQEVDNNYYNDVNSCLSSIEQIRVCGKTKSSKTFTKSVKNTPSRLTMTSKPYFRIGCIGRL
ncbi:MAG: hypothetical protein KME60_34585, partial [Cyanomargarita calcarea GSE-NOS-MK-12-04C]|nr:hypothetical protein [Cyanomargarita calcarea GSE-NOS-MK-12-04C]